MGGGLLDEGHIAGDGHPDLMPMTIGRRKPKGVPTPSVTPAAGHRPLAPQEARKGSRWKWSG